MSSVINHLGQCVTDGARSRRFYEEVLGFEFWREIEPPDEMTREADRPRATDRRQGRLPAPGTGSSSS